MRTDEAAGELGVSDRHVRRLVQTGALRGESPSPRVLLVDRASVERYKQERRPRGRPAREAKGSRP